MYKFEISSSGLENCSMILVDTNRKVKYELKLYITVLFSFNSDIRTLWKNKQYFRNWLWNKSIQQIGEVGLIVCCNLHFIWQDLAMWGLLIIPRKVLVMCSRLTTPLLVWLPRRTLRSTSRLARWSAWRAVSAPRYLSSPSQNVSWWSVSTAGPTTSL